MRKNGMEFGALGVIEERRDFSLLQRPGEPLHVILHENLHGGAFDRAGTVDGHMRAATDGHVGAEENSRFSILDFRFRRRHE